MRSDPKNTSKKPLSNFWRRANAYNQYRVVRVSTLEALSNREDVGAKDNSGAAGDPDKNTDYQNQFFEPCKQLQPDEVDNKNYGLNPRANQLSEIDEVMQALRLMPDMDAGADLNHT